MTPCELLSLQTEKSVPAFPPSNPGKESRRGRQMCAGRSTLTPPGPPNPSQAAAALTAGLRNLQEAAAQRNEPPHPNVKVRAQSEGSSGLTDRSGSGRSRGPSPTHSVSLARESRRRGNFKVRFDETPKQASRGGTGGDSPHIPGAERPLTPCRRPAEMSARPRTAGDGGSDLAPAAAGVELRNDPSEREKAPRGVASRPRAPPRSPVPTGPRPAVGRGGAGALALLELQDSFSKSAAHRSFDSSVTGSSVSLRHRVAPGRKHNFFGINCYYLRG